MKGLTLRPAVVIAAAAQALSSPLIGLDESAVPEPVIVPDGWAFAIWGPILGLSALYAIDQARPSRRAARVLDEVAPALVGVYTAFWVWLLAANADLLWLTVAIFVAMLAALAWVLGRLLRAEDLPRGTRALALAAVGLYAGWATVAVWANLAVALVSSGADPAGTGWQAAVLMAAGATAVVGAGRFRAAPAYVAALLWAFAGVAAGAAQDGSAVLPAAAAAAGAAVLATALAGLAPRFAGRARGRAR